MNRHACPQCGRPRNISCYTGRCVPDMHGIKVDPSTSKYILTATTYHEIDNEVALDWVLAHFAFANWPARELERLHTEGSMYIEDRIPAKGVVLKSTVTLRRVP